MQISEWTTIEDLYELKNTHFKSQVYIYIYGSKINSYIDKHRKKIVKINFATNKHAGKIKQFHKWR